MELAQPLSCLLVLITAGSEEEAMKIGRALVDRQLAACANVVSGVQSIFHWEGKVTEEKEVLLLVKSRHELFDEIEKAVKALHSYEVPEIIGIEIGKGSKTYLDWIRTSTVK